MGCFGDISSDHHWKTTLNHKKTQAVEMFILFELLFNFRLKYLNLQKNCIREVPYLQQGEGSELVQTSEEERLGKC